MCSDGVGGGNSRGFAQQEETINLAVHTIARGFNVIPVIGRVHQAAITVTISATYIAAYLALDWVSFNNALHGINITPWDPSSGLTLAFLIVKGVRYTPAVALAELLSSKYLVLVPVPLWVALGGALVVAIGYALAAAILRQLLTDGPNMYRARDVAMLIAVTVVASGAVALGYVAIYAAHGVVPWEGDYHLD